MIKYDDKKNPYPDVNMLSEHAHGGYRKGFEACANEANAEIEKLEKKVKLLLDRLVKSRPYKCPEGTEGSYDACSINKKCQDCWDAWLEEESKK